MKRSRPAFEPPRPKASHQTTASRKSNAGEQTQKKKRVESTSTTSRQARKKSSGQPRQTADSQKMFFSDNEDEDQDQDQSHSDASLSNDDDDSSPEPDFILAEIADEPPTGNQEENGLSLALIQRIVTEHFEGKNKTNMTTDARQVVGKYIEIFVREAIMRSAYERNERDRAEGATGAMSGWLEVEDLERIAPQLCLDF